MVSKFDRSRRCAGPSAPGATFVVTFGRCAHPIGAIDRIRTPPRPQRSPAARHCPCRHRQVERSVDVSRQLLNQQSARADTDSTACPSCSAIRRQDPRIRSESESSPDAPPIVPSVPTMVQKPDIARFSLAKQAASNHAPVPVWFRALLWRLCCGYPNENERLLSIGRTNVGEHILLSLGTCDEGLRRWLTFISKLLTARTLRCRGRGTRQAASR